MSGARAEASNLEQHVAVALRALGVELVDLAPDHVLDEGVLGRVGRQSDRHRAPVGEHRHAVADALDLVEAVRDVDHAHTLGREPPDDPEQRLDLVVIEDRRRLVHDQ